MNRLLCQTDLTCADSTPVQRIVFYCGGQHREKPCPPSHKHTHTRITHSHAHTRIGTPSHTRSYTCEVKEVFDLWCCHTDLCRILPLRSCACVRVCFVHMCVCVEVSCEAVTIVNLIVLYCIMSRNVMTCLIL